MKITFVLPYAGLQGGVRVIAIYADRLQRRGHDVVVISTPEIVTFRRKLKTLLLERRLPQQERSYLDELNIDHRTLERVRDVTDDDVPDADVVIATYYTTVPGVLKLSASKGAKAIFIQNYEMREGRPNAALDASWHSPMHKITISHWLVDLAKTKFGDSFVSHVPNSVDTQQFHARSRGKQAQPTLGFLYNTFSLKGLDTSFAAIKAISAKLPSLRLIAFGAERPDPRYPLPLGTTFFHQPPQETIRDIYAQCDVWMCGSNVEGFHLPPLEAMACRCPVVSTRVGGPLDTIVEGVNGYLVDVKDAEALADRALRVLTLPEPAWLRMSEEAHRTATRFTWDDAASMFESALSVAVERERRGDWLSHDPLVAARV